MYFLLDFTLISLGVPPDWGLPVTYDTLHLATTVIFEEPFPSPPSSLFSVPPFPLYIERAAHSQYTTLSRSHWCPPRSSDSVSTMAALGISMGACFGIRIPQTVIEAVCAHVDLTEFFPAELRRIMIGLVRSQLLTPAPTYIAAVSALGVNCLEFYLFFGSDFEEFGTVPGLYGIAARFEDHLRHFFKARLPEDSDHLADLITVTWEPNLLVNTSANN